MSFKTGDYCYKNDFIFIKVEESNYKSNNIAISKINKYYYNSSAAMASYNAYPDRLATKEEINWLNTCIRLNKFIPLNQIKINTYEIY